MNTALREWWTGLSRRERVASGVALVGVLLTALYLLAIEPAWRARARLGSELPRLRSEAAEIEALGQDAKKLRTRSLVVDSPAQAKAGVVKLLAEKNLTPTSVQETDDQRLVVSVRRADAASYLAWLRDTSSEMPLRISAARVSRAASGVVDAEVTLTPVGPR
ncbi:MAG TPA: type II secretion system protein GspM [Burkholderiales bacterium]|nr:type II secretion system protein GspM [Burkholderiales bacterium]